MSQRNRKWLRSFLRMGARAEKDGIPAGDIERQEDTVLRALDMLDTRPGVVLADEVGMGKTYEALGIAAALRHEKPRSRIVVITPGPDLNTKWFSDFSHFKDMFDFKGDVAAATRLSEFVELLGTHPVVVAPLTIFQSGRGSADQAYLLSLYFRWKGLHGHTANAIMRRFGDGRQERVDVDEARFLGEFDLSTKSPWLKAAFRRGGGGGAEGLDDLFERDGIAAFETKGKDQAVKNALSRARFILVGKLLPTIDLLIVDEAHKLKNPGALRTQAMRRVFDKRFKKALFLTATPFQLSVHELRQIFSLFSGAAAAPDDLDVQVNALLDAVSEYQRQYDAFQTSWASLDPIVAEEFCSLYERGPAALKASKDSLLKAITGQALALKKLKDDTIEPGFREWMIRSLRDDKRVYREHVPKSIAAGGKAALPFLIYERFIAELFRRGRQTHKAAVEINMVSSYAAAAQGAILAGIEDMPAEAAAYRDLLRGILSDIGERGHEHPKVAAVVADALNAAESGEKTLIFCSRVATLEQLRRDLDALWESRVLERWRKVYPGAAADDIFDTHEADQRRHRGRHSLLQGRFHSPHDALYLALREPYLRTSVPWADWAINRLPDVVKEANRILRRERVGKTAAERLDYSIAKRCVEQAVLRLRRASGLRGADALTLKRTLSADHARVGSDSGRPSEESLATGEAQPQWQISERVAEMVLGAGGSLWESLADLLARLTPVQRVRVVEQLARYLTYKQVPFLAELLAEAKAAGLAVDPVESAGLYDYLPRFWTTDTGQRWVKQYRVFLEYFLQRDSAQQDDILSGPIRTGDFARHTREGESRERLREAFNTPLYPMVLVANEVMQEGLDLHKHCRRIVHHDLAWNPAQIEQRIGRIDRLGSLTSRLRASGDDVKLEVMYPLIVGTIDQRLYRTVKVREKWLEFLLGAPPNFTEYDLSGAEPMPLPDRLSRELTIELGPRRGG